jgi:cellulose synthase/poly-beta-1,6-N-acetylglucosamine synthase-like glycosyltransferase
MIYGWISPELLSENTMPQKYLPETTFFSIIVPCRHEENVIGSTLRQLAKQKYAHTKMEIIVPIASNDTKTIIEVEKISKKMKTVLVKSVIFFANAVNKSHALNIALNECKGDYIVVFDAEDDVNPKLLSFVNTIIATEGRKIIQTGVSLMNWQSSWFTIHAVLEYFFWFNSRLHWYAKRGIVPLGGVGAFIPKEIITEIGGWNEDFLTEDAKLGIDCSARNKAFRILCDETYSIKEEVPVTIQGFVKQRTRWIQGFLQLVLDKNWMEFSLKNRINFLLLILFPIFQAFLFLWIIWSAFFAPKLPILLVMFSEIPFGILLFQIAIQLSGAAEMLRIRKELKKFPLFILFYLISFLPYQLLIAFAAIRAGIRQTAGVTVWEKTLHENYHRDPKEQFDDIQEVAI